MRLDATIGLVAKPGGGKGTFSRLLRDVCYKDNYHPGISKFRFSDPLRKTLQWFEALESRENLQNLSICLDAIKPGALAAGLKKMLEDDKFSDIKIADGVRWIYDETMIRSLSRGFVVYIKADPETRLARVRLRKENKGDEDKTMEQFLAEDAAKTEQWIDEIGSRADFVIDNTGTMDSYKEQVRVFYDKFLRPLRLQG